MVDEVDGVEQNVVELAAHTAQVLCSVTQRSEAIRRQGKSGLQVESAAILQTASLFSSGRYEVPATVRMPPHNATCAVVGQS